MKSHVQLVEEQCRGDNKYAKIPVIQPSVIECLTFQIRSGNSLRKHTPSAVFISFPCERAIDLGCVVSLTGNKLLYQSL